MNDVATTLGQIWDDVWSKGENIFNRLVDLEFYDRETDILAKQWGLAMERERLTGAGAPQWSPPSPAAPTTTGQGINLTQVALIGGGLLLAGLLVYRVAK